MIRLRQWAGRDDGRVSILVAVVAAAIVFLVAVVVDAGGQVRAMQRADNVAAQAARAAGQGIDLSTAISGGTKQVDPARAVAAAETYLAATGATGTVTISPDRRQITVNATVIYQPTMLGAFGHGPISVHGTATAQLVTT